MGFPEITWRAHLAIREKSSIFSMEVRGGKPLNPKSKNTVIREKTFLILIPCLSLVDTRFVLLFLEFTKKILASVYERLNESSINSPSGKPLLKILAARWFLL